MFEIHAIFDRVDTLKIAIKMELSKSEFEIHRKFDRNDAFQIGIKLRLNESLLRFMNVLKMLML